MLFEKVTGVIVTSLRNIDHWVKIYPSQMSLENSSTNYYPCKQTRHVKTSIRLYISKKKKSALTISLILLCRSGFQEHSVKDFHLKTQTQDDFCKKCFEPQVSIIWGKQEQ